MAIEFAQDEYKILFCVIMAHGNKDGVFCSDEQHVSHEEIVSTFAAVMGKPKVRIEDFGKMHTFSGTT